MIFTVQSHITLIESLLSSKYDTTWSAGEKLDVLAGHTPTAIPTHNLVLGIDIHIDYQGRPRHTDLGGRLHVDY